MSTALLDCGRKPDPGRRRQAEECSGRLTVRAWLDGDAPADVGTLDLVVTRPHFGGERRWFACPACGGRAGVLYRPDDGDPWRCRRCHGLAYRSAQRAHEGERLWVAFRRIFDHLEANDGWGRGEELFDGLGHAEAMAMIRAILYLDMGGLEAERAAFGGPAEGRPGAIPDRSCPLLTTPVHSGPLPGYNGHAGPSRAPRGHPMTIAARTTPGPRYGSPSEVAAFLGVSSKTVRRLIAAGTVPAYRVGRRVLVAFRDADQIVRRGPTMSIAHPTDTPLIDPTTGRLRPLSDEERRARSAELRRALDDIADITDGTDTDEIWADVFRGLDAARAGCPPSGPGS